MFNPFMCLIELWICVYIILPIRIVRTLCKYLFESRFISIQNVHKMMGTKSNDQHFDHLIDSNWKAAIKVQNYSRHTTFSTFSTLPRIIEDDAEV